ncbi:hypothetical protein SBADM41S_11594 [Streptomyces badius]
MPSSSASAIARRPASGVRRSCEIHATSSRREVSSARSRSRELSSFALVAASSRASSASSAVGCPAGAAKVPPSPNDRVASVSSRLRAATQRPSRTAVARETTAAMATTVVTT